MAAAGRGGGPGSRSPTRRIGQCSPGRAVIMIDLQTMDSESDSLSLPQADRLARARSDYRYSEY